MPTRETPFQPESAPAVPGPPAVEVEGVRVVRGGKAILDHVSVTIPAGTCAAILGPNGCGKTSLTRVITGHMFTSRGSVRVLGETIGRTDVRTLRRRIAVVNPAADAAGQHESGAVVDADLTTLDAAITGYFGTVGLYDRPTHEQRDHAAHLLRHVGLTGHESQRFGLLSTGEKRRCLIARALVHTPELLILDEPTAGLDLRGREQVLATIEMLLARPNIAGRTTTVLMITHHVEELSPRTSQLMLMRDGRITHAGTPADIITPETLTATFGCKVFVRRLHGRYWLEVLPEAWLELIRPTAASP
jgi:iron complex transport system ATP-binding protein